MVAAMRSSDALVCGVAAWCSMASSTPMSDSTNGRVAAYACAASAGMERRTWAKKMAFLAATDGMRTARSSSIISTAAGTRCLCSRWR